MVLPSCRLVPCGPLPIGQPPRESPARTAISSSAGVPGQSGQSAPNASAHAFGQIEDDLALPRPLLETRATTGRGQRVLSFRLTMTPCPAHPSSRTRQAGSPRWCWPRSEGLRVRPSRSRKSTDPTGPRRCLVRAGAGHGDGRASTRAGRHVGILCRCRILRHSSSFIFPPALGSWLGGSLHRSWPAGIGMAR